MLVLDGRARKKGIFLHQGNVEDDLISCNILLPQDTFIFAAQQPCSSQVQAAPPSNPSFPETTSIADLSRGIRGWSQ